jgi:hypothetical protein
LKPTLGGSIPISEEFPIDPNNPADPSVALNLADWDGIAIWIRRGPNGQPTIRVGLTEKHSAEDLNIGSEAHPERESKYCKRYRLCGCAAGSACTPRKADANDSYCWDPSNDPEPLSLLDDLTIFEPEACGVTRCNENNTSTGIPDALFQGRACSPAVTSDGQASFFCYNPGEDPTPPAKRERCGNPFSRPVTVTLDWQLVKVPFSELRQADEMNVADGIDLKSVKQLVFTHTTGYIDFYVSNIGFYRAL